MQSLWKPGEQIVEIRVAKELGVGQHVVREALQQLEFEGYVHKIPNRGSFVIKLAREDVAQLFNFRIELESLAARWARQIKQPDDDKYAHISGVLNRMEAGARRGNYAQFQEADFEFHSHLWNLCGNRHLVRALEVATRPQFTFSLLRQSGETSLQLKAITKQHREWLEFLRTATPDKAAHYTKKLIQSFKEQVLNSWEG